ncbi:hypothetical protein [Streptomyces sp. NPDC005898]|uniref:hypothetical protein n=1 Tax=Streptomyces sp. NPDC005898 TaxID=3157082 RepID=UPI00340C037E
MTTYKYNRNDVRTETAYPGGTVQAVDVDNSSSPEKITAKSCKGTLVDLADIYGYGADAKTDGDKIRTKTDTVAGRKTKRTVRAAPFRRQGPRHAPGAAGLVTQQGPAVPPDHRDPAGRRSAAVTTSVSAWKQI